MLLVCFGLSVRSTSPFSFTVQAGRPDTITDPAMDAADRETVVETSIEELEAEIDEAVYDRFELTDAEREIVEGYLDVF